MELPQRNEVSDPAVFEEPDRLGLALGDAACAGERLLVLEPAPRACSPQLALKR